MKRKEHSVHLKQMQKLLSDLQDFKGALIRLAKKNWKVRVYKKAIRVQGVNGAYTLWRNGLAIGHFKTSSHMRTVYLKNQFGLTSGYGGGNVGYFMFKGVFTKAEVKEILLKGKLKNRILLQINSEMSDVFKTKGGKGGKKNKHKQAR